MELNKMKNINGTYLYQDEGFNTISITLNFLANQDSRSSAILDILSIYLLRCNQVYKTDNDINLRTRELYNMDISFNQETDGKQRFFHYYIDLISMNAVNDDYSKEAFSFIRDILLKPDFNNEEVLEISKKKLISYIDSSLSDYDKYAEALYGQTVLPVENKKYDQSVDRKYLEELINSITLDDLKREYQYLMNNYLNGVVVGNISEEQFTEFVNCMDLKSNYRDLDYDMDVKTIEGDVEVQKECKQSYIYVTYDFTKLTNAEVRILEWILNSSIGLCYQTLREKYGLVYGSYAEILFHEKKLYIYGETAASKKEKFIKGADEIVASLCNKEIMEKYMKQAKEEIANDEYSLSESKNRLAGIINGRILKIYGDKDREIVNQEIEDMKVEDLMNKTKTLVRKNVFMVRGKKHE